MTSEDFASMGIDQLEAKLIGIATDRAAEHRRKEEALSGIGQQILERKQKLLVEARTRYLGLKIDGAIDSDIVRALIAAQTRERLIAQDVSDMQKAGDRFDALDKQYKLCKDALTVKKNQARTGR